MYPPISFGIQNHNFKSCSAHFWLECSFEATKTTVRKREKSSLNNFEHRFSILMCIAMLFIRKVIYLRAEQKTSIHVLHQVARAPL